jgi:hypothetical protein
LAGALFITAAVRIVVVVPRIGDTAALLLALAAFVLNKGVKLPKTTSHERK